MLTEHKVRNTWTEENTITQRFFAIIVYFKEN